MEVSLDENGEPEDLPPIAGNPRLHRIADDLHVQLTAAIETGSYVHKSSRGVDGISVTAGKTAYHILRNNTRATTFADSKVPAKMRAQTAAKTSLKSVEAHLRTVMQISALEMDDMKEIVDDFLVEADELVSSLDINLVKLETSPRIRCSAIPATEISGWTRPRRVRHSHRQTAPAI